MRRRTGRCLVALAALVSLALPAAAQARDMYATDNRGNLLRFDSRFPGVITDRVAIAGLSPGAALVGIDFRPSTGQLVGVGSDSVVYVIDESSGRAQPLGPPFTPGLSGNAGFGVEVNPVIDQLRVVSDTGMNARISLANGAHAPGSPLPPLNPGTPHVAAIGYAGSTFTAVRPAATRLVAVDSASNQVVVVDPPDAGTLRDAKALGINITDPVGLDVSFLPGVGDVVYMVATPAGGSGANLYRVSLVTGRAFKFGPVGTGSYFGGRPRLTLTGFAVRQAFASPGLNIPPEVRIHAENPRPRPGRRALYVALGTDHDGGVERVQWDTDGDGAFDDATGERLVKAFPAGTRTLAVRVTDNSGGRTTGTLRIVVRR